MGPVNCAAARRNLAAFHDNELDVGARRRVAGHLDVCPQCCAEVQALQRVGDTLRANTGTRPGADEMASLMTNVMSRLAAERQVSLHAQIGRWFEDMHLVWAGIAATTGAFVCALAIYGLVAFGVAERGDSLSAILAALGSPGSNANPVRPDGGVSLPRVSLELATPAMFIPRSPDEAELVLALAAVVTREGRIAGLEVLQANDEGRIRLLELVRAAQDVRFEPARVAGAPVAVNLVWLVAHTTVRGRAHG